MGWKLSRRKLILVLFAVLIMAVSIGLVVSVEAASRSGTESGNCGSYTWYGASDIDLNTDYSCTISGASAVQGFYYQIDDTKLQSGATATLTLNGAEATLLGITCNEDQGTLLCEDRSGSSLTCSNFVTDDCHKYVVAFVTPSTATDFSFTIRLSGTKKETCGDGTCESWETCAADSCCRGTTKDLQTDKYNCGSCNVIMAGTFFKLGNLF